MAPVPSANDDVPLPAKLVTTPSGVILRIKCKFTTTYKLLDESIVKPCSILNDALVPVSSVFPYEPLPAKVVTTPSGVILRILKLLESATYTFPLESTAIPRGVLNLAFVPVPVIFPCELPARVVTTPAGVILRIR